MATCIVFDADDTLWETDPLYEEARRDCIAIMVGAGIAGPERLDALSRQIDRENLAILGFSQFRFPSSMVQTYLAACEQDRTRERIDVAGQIFDVARSVFSKSAQNVDQVEFVLQDLIAQGCSLYMWTKGDEDVQKKRIKDSGLSRYFNDVEVSRDKTPASLSELLQRWDPRSEHSWWVVGNSVRSDINPAIEAGLSAILIPSAAWDIEHDTLLPHPDGAVFAVDGLADLRQVILPADNDDRVTAQIESGSAVYLFVSAYHDLYRQYVLDILAYPRGHVVRFPYDGQWLPSPARADPLAFWNMLAGKSALIVYVDERMEGQPRRTQRFYPLRLGTIRNAPAERAEVGGGVVHVEFELGPYVFYGDTAQKRSENAEAYQRELMALEARPRLRRDDSAYISIGPGFEGRIHSKQHPDEDDDAWQSVVSILGDLENAPPPVSRNPHMPKFESPFKNAMFYAVLSLKDLRRKKLVPLESILNGDSGFSLHPSCNYRFDLLFYHPHRPPPAVRRSKIQAVFTPDAISGVGPTTIPLNFRYDRRPIHFVTSRVMDSTWAQLNLCVEPPSDDNTDQPRAVAPEPTFLMKVNVGRREKYLAPAGFATFTAVAALGSALSEWASTTFPNLADSQKELALLLPIIGTLGATWILFRQYGRLK